MGRTTSSPAPTIACALPVKTNGAPPAARSSSARRASSRSAGAPAVGRVAAALGALEELEDVGAVVRAGLEDLTHGRDRRQRAQLGEAVRHVGAGQAVGETLQARQLVVPPSTSPRMVVPAASGWTASSPSTSPAKGPCPPSKVPRANQVMAPDPRAFDGTLPSGYSRHSP